MRRSHVGPIGLCRHGEAARSAHSNGWCEQTVPNALPGSSELDLRDPSATDGYFSRYNPDTVFHCAATVFGLGGNATRQFEILANNARLDLSILSACKRPSVERIGYAGSVAAYAHPYKRLPLVEEDFASGSPHYGEFGYASAKRLAAAMLEILSREHGKVAVFGCLTNLYGPNDRYNIETGHVIPSLIKRCVAAKEASTDLTVWGDGSGRRDFLFADDAAAALIHLTESNADGIINIASGQSVTIAEVVDLVVASVGFTGRIIYDPNRPSGIAHRSVDVGRLRAAGYESRTPLREGIKSAVDWYIRNIAGSRG